MKQDKNSASFFFPGLWREGIGPLHGEARLPHFWRVCRCEAGELRSDVIDDVKVAVRPVIVSQPDVRADCRVQGYNPSPHPRGDEVYVLVPADRLEESLAILNS